MKKSGVALLATIISIAVLLLVSGGFFTIMASNTGLIKSSGESLQAQYFAQLEADIIKMLSYDEVDNITQDTWQEFDIDNSWQYKVNVGPEQNVGDSDNTMKIASISVRKSGDTIDRFALDVPLSSQSNNNSINVPSIDFAKGVIIESKAGYVYNYVCPENGIIIRHWQTGYSVNYYSNYVKVNDGINLYYTEARLTINEFTHHLYYYVKKGDKITCFFTSSGNLTFYPCR